MKPLANQNKTEIIFFSGFFAAFSFSILVSFLLFVSLFVIILCIVIGMKNRNILKCSSLHRTKSAFLWLSHCFSILFIGYSTVFSIYNATNHFPSWTCFMLIVSFRFCSKHLPFGDGLPLFSTLTLARSLSLNKHSFFCSIAFDVY